MFVIAVSSQKGGSGKTTLAAHLAVQADRCDLGPVAMIDTDPQGSLADWWNVRQAITPHFARTSVSTLAQDIGRLRNLGMSYVFIDTPPAITATIRDVVELSDLVIIPTRPSPHDLRAAGRRSIWSSSSASHWSSPSTGRPRAPVLPQRPPSRCPNMAPWRPRSCTSGSTSPPA